MDIQTLGASIGYTKKATKKAVREAVNQAKEEIVSFNIRVEDNRNILSDVGEANVLYLVPKTGETGDGFDEYLYVENNWEWIGHTIIDLSNYALKTEIPDISGKYEKPSGGIPKTDLDSSVQSSLGKADTALQSHQDISGKANVATTIAGYGITDAYTKTEINTMIGDIETLLQGV